MSKISIIAVVTVLCLMMSMLWLYAQKPSEPEFELGNPEYRALAKKFDALAQEVREMKKADFEMSQKLDKVLSNQEKILSELAIVKVRATMAR